MKKDKGLPDDPAKLKEFILKQELSYEKKLRLLEEEVTFWKNKLFGRKSEKHVEEDELQGRLFNEAETYTTAPEESDDDDSQTETQVFDPKVKTKKRGRKPIPANLPREEIVHKLSEEERQCDCGSLLTKIGEEISEKIKYIPATIVVQRTIRYKYACNTCEGVESEDNGGAVKIAPLPKQLIPKSLATPSLINFMLISKFCDGLPFHRVVSILKRHGIEISRQTLCNWAIKIADALLPLLNLLQKDLLSGPLIGIDETTLQVLKEPGRSPTTLSYMWIFRGGPPEKPVVIYNYKPTRSGKFLKGYLEGFEGYIQCDAYKGYEYLDAENMFILVACWAHARRKFCDAAKVTKAKTGSSHMALSFIRKLYAIEKEIKGKNLDPNQIKALRQEKALPILNKFKKWLDNKVYSVPPSSLLGKAINYTLNIWTKLTRYLEDGNIPIDNNLVENALRPFVIGRKNWLFSASPLGAYSSAVIYSIIETAKAKNLDPYWYFLHVLESLPYAETTEDYKALLPQNVDPDKVKARIPS